MATVTAGYNWVSGETVTPAKLNSAAAPTVALTAEERTPAGAVMAFAMNSAPTGWLAADGTAVSRSTYASLFSAIGTTYGVGDGSTTFALPDLRGIFVRGSGSQTISGTAYSGTLAEKQAEDLQSHSHTGTTASDGNHSHAYDDLYNTTTGVTGGGGGAGWQTGFFTSRRNTLAAGAHTHTFTSDATGGTETRPANIALLYCIKF
jgi:microcystin-dependent protein